MMWESLSFRVLAGPPTPPGRRWCTSAATTQAPGRRPGRSAASRHMRPPTDQAGSGRPNPAQSATSCLRSPAPWRRAGCWPATGNLTRCSGARRCHGARPAGRARTGWPGRRQSPGRNLAVTALLGPTVRVRRISDIDISLARRRVPPASRAAGAPTAVRLTLAGVHREGRGIRRRYGAPWSRLPCRRPEGDVRCKKHRVDLEGRGFGIEVGDLPGFGCVTQLGGDQVAPVMLLTDQRVADRAAGCRTRPGLPPRNSRPGTTGSRHKRSTAPVVHAAVPPRAEPRGQGGPRPR